MQGDELVAARRERRLDVICQVDLRRLRRLWLPAADRAAAAGRRGVDALHVGLRLPGHLVRAPRDVGEEAGVVRRPRVGGREQRVQARASRRGCFAPEAAIADRSKARNERYSDAAPLRLANLEDGGAVRPRRAIPLDVDVLARVDDHLLTVRKRGEYHAAPAGPH